MKIKISKKQIEKLLIKAGKMPNAYIVIDSSTIHLRTNAGETISSGPRPDESMIEALERLVEKEYHHYIINQGKIISIGE